MSMKSKCNSTVDKRTYAYLNILIYQKTKQLEEESKFEVFDIDQAIIVDRNFQEYKKLIYETTILVEKFWMNLKKVDFLMKD